MRIGRTRFTEPAKVARRQCVLAGKVDANGQPSLLASTGGLNFNIEASATVPLLLAFAAGYDDRGDVDYLESATANLAVTAPANSTIYIYVQRNSAGSLSASYSTLRPIYSRTPPASPSTGQHWFNTSPNISTTGQGGMRMYEWFSSAWYVRDRVFIGEAVSGASTLTALTTYAYQRRYQSAWTAVTSGQTVVFAHNFGMSIAEAEATWALYGRNDSADTNAAIVGTITYFGSDGYGGLPQRLTTSRLNQQFALGAAGIYNDPSLPGWRTSCQLQFILNGGW